MDDGGRVVRHGAGSRLLGTGQQWDSHGRALLGNVGGGGGTVGPAWPWGHVRAHAHTRRSGDGRDVAWDPVRLRVRWPVTSVHHGAADKWGGRAEQAHKRKSKEPRTGSGAPTRAVAGQQRYGAQRVSTTETLVMPGQGYTDGSAGVESRAGAVELRHVETARAQQHRCAGCARQHEKRQR